MYDGFINIFLSAVIEKYPIERFAMPLATNFAAPENRKNRHIAAKWIFFLFFWTQMVTLNLATRLFLFQTISMSNPVKCQDNTVLSHLPPKV